MQEPIGTVAAIALKTAHGGPMQEVTAAQAEVNGTLAGSASVNPNRGVTLLSSRVWQTVMNELGVELPWHTRRANVLIDADALGELRGKTVQIGEALLEVIAETRPCELMDQFQPGLQAALKPDCRAGVYGRVIRAGTIRIGDHVGVAASQSMPG